MLRHTFVLHNRTRNVSDRASSGDESAPNGGRVFGRWRGGSYLGRAWGAGLVRTRKLAPQPASSGPPRDDGWRPRARQPARLAVAATPRAGVATAAPQSPQPERYGRVVEPSRPGESPHPPSGRSLNQGGAPSPPKTARRPAGPKARPLFLRCRARPAQLAWLPTTHRPAQVSEALRRTSSTNASAPLSTPPSGARVLRESK
jgi:hypothetical protein